jgi:SAM-dependent methyltransferase
VLAQIDHSATECHIGTGPVEHAVTDQESPALTWTENREAEAAAAVATQPPDYKRYHQARAASFGCLTEKSVLVVGCNRGEDCEYFVDAGARSVVGVDVMEDVGRNLTHRAVSYIRASAEEMPVAGGSFDLVFAYATLEHVPDIRRAFRELARVAAPGGFIYSAAAPLWCARSGPHWGGAFDHAPWPHLRMSVEEVVALGGEARTTGSSNPYHSPDIIRHHLTDTRLFNRRRAHEYVDACLAVDGIRIIRNDVEFEAQTSIEPHVIEALFEKGYTAFDLFGLTHMFVAAKLAAGNVKVGESNYMLEVLRGELNELRKERDTLRRKGDALRRERDASRDAMSALLASTSWRVTAPMRGIFQPLKRNRHFKP